MKKLVLLLLVCCCTLATAAQEYWMGLVTTANLPITLTYTSGIAPSLRLGSPTQSAETVEATSFEWVGNLLTASFDEWGIRLKLELDSVDYSLSGSFRQGGMKFPFTMQKTDTLFRAARPQTPKPPYAFDTVPFSYRTVRGDDDIELHGTLALPKGVEGKCPMALLISGSGQQDRDETLFEHKPFLVIADYFARHGIATLRYDDRGVGESTGPVMTATTYDFYRDAYGLLSSLSLITDQNQYPIDVNRMGVVGHSEGAFIGQMLAAEHSDEIAFLIMLGGQGYNGDEVLLRQNEALLRLDGIDDSLIEVRIDCMREMFSLLDTVTEHWFGAAISRTIERHVGHLSREQRKALSLRNIDASMWEQQLGIPWMQYFVRYTDPKETLPKIQCPILAINGEKDRQVLPINLDEIKRLTQGKATTLLRPNLNHLFQHCTTGLPSEYSIIEETFDEETLKIMVEWIKSL